MDTSTPDFVEKTPVPLVKRVAKEWSDFFATWPDDVPRRGIMVTQLNEQIPFSGYFSSPYFLLLERSTPDSLGARTIILQYSQITAVKITEVIKPKSFRTIGFEGPVAKK